MEYLVTMTTHVPAGVTAEKIAELRAREAAHTRELAREGRVRRLWRPPLGPGEWRTIGLFDAAGADDVERILASMPLRIWRTDEVTPLGTHGNDPGRDRVALDPDRTEYLTTFVVTVPPGAGAAEVDAMAAREAARTRELAAQNALIRLWTLPGALRNLGHWQVADADEMHEVLRSLPMADWLGVETVALTRHPNDPATSGADVARSSSVR